MQLRPEQRAAYLNEACDGDGELRRRVEALLQAHERAGGFLEDPATDPQASRATVRLPTIWTEGCGDRIGRYKLLQQIGEGGCGIVYMAEQETPVHRRVALKVIKLGMDTRSVIARFEAERQALALMDHPNIARVFDAGATETGRPFFVMELVRGVRITDYCDQGSLSTRERLDLFVHVCHAVQHAHQKGIIHRDLKPSNILVTVNDGVPVPKVIDFGIAKATQGRLTDHTLFTAFEQFIGTPAYMSPEQAVLTSLEVDTRSDIYSLGVLLYELLTGQTPFAQKDLLEAGLEQMRRTIREKEPLRPSTRLSVMVAGDLATVARHRQSEPPRLIHLVRGDLDWIVMKCLQKDRGRRYETANGLAMDILRHLNNEPVVARPDTRAYRMAKFVRRHRASATFAVVVLVSLAGGLIGTITQARRATQHARTADEQRDFALRQLSRAEAINDLNTFLLSDAAPSGKSFTVGELLARAERVMEKQTGDADENRVELLISIGHQYEIRDEHGKARELLGEAYALSRKLSEPSIRAKAAAALSVSIALAGEIERGESLIREALRELGDAPQFVLHRVFSLLRGSRVAREADRGQLGIERVQEADRLLRNSGQGSSLLDLTIAMELAEAYRMAGRNREAASAFAAAFKQLSALGRDDTEKAGTLLNNWGVALEALGQPLEAERLYRRAIAISTAENKNEDAVSPMLLNNLARTLGDLHRFPEAAQYAEQAYERAKRADDQHVVNMCLNVRTSLYREQGDLERAGQMLGEFEAKTRQLLPPGHIAFAIVASQKAQLALARGDAHAAVDEANRALAMAEAKPETRLSFLFLRRAAAHMGALRYDAARADAARSLALNQEATGSEMLSSWSGLAYLTMGRALNAQGKPKEARLAYASALEHLGPTLGPDHPESREAAEKARNSGLP
ncbi:MAG TPA: serine/threonine-protein kinase [Verrucomicrobiae bacterium]|nr:serine/threonine-protein kinase [Verrucomicrobiae bacterium]